MAFNMKFLALFLTFFQGEECWAFHPIASFRSGRSGRKGVDGSASKSSRWASDGSGTAFSIESDHSGPAGFPVHRVTFHTLPGQEEDVPPICIETGKIGRQAAGAVTLTRGDSVLYATTSHDKDPKEEIDFCPLSVDYQERFSSAGLTSGGYNKRDGRPAEHEILTCRLIDRPLRPLIQSGWRHETQLLSWVLSYDGERSCDPLAIIASASSLFISDVPLHKPVAAVQVGMKDDGTLVVNPTNLQMETSKLNLMVAGTEEAVLMIEGAADFLPESTMIQAVKTGHEAIQVLCQGLTALGKVAGKEKKLDTIKATPENLQIRVDELFSDRIDDMWSSGLGKEAQGKIMTDLYTAVVGELIEDYPGETVAIKGAFKDLLCRRMFFRAREEGLRCDGRGPTDIRQLTMETGLLPRVHGSALFTRGETQCVATTTLGGSGMRQKIEKLDGTDEKRFYLQYTFPPSCVGETGRVGAPGRREVGHGNLAERALIPTIPALADFPYTIRVESLITESHGSSSMASVCGGSLALMDAGVPIKAPVAGIAMGMLLGDKGGVSDENAVILSDILGTEDALGTMDFKVAGDRVGISTFQLDIKCEGLTLETMESALEQARTGRLHLLSEMEKVIASPREELPATVPKMMSFSIPVEAIGKIIGPGGKQIRAIIEDFELVNMDVGEEGGVQLSSFDTAKMGEAQTFITTLVSSAGRNGRGPREERPKYEGPEPVEGETYTGKITGIHPFGVFLEILPGAEDGSYPGLEGLVHVSELAHERVRNCEGFMKSMNVEELTVKYLGKDKGKLQLSRKALLEEQGGDGGRRNGSRGPSREAAAPTPEMTKDEIDVIAQAIEGVTEL